MSEFDDSMTEALKESLDEIGTTEFRINGTPYQGDLDELGDRSYTIEIGGKEVVVSAHLLCLLPQFASGIPKAGTRLKIGTDLYVIASFSTDKSSVTFTIADADAS